MSMNKITGPGRVSPTSMESTAMESTPSSATAASAVAASATALDRLTQQSPPARFPWLNRLSHELETAARQSATFPAAPMIGDSLDQAA